MKTYIIVLFLLVIASYKGNTQTFDSIPGLCSSCTLNTIYGDENKGVIYLAGSALNSAILHPNQSWDTVSVVGRSVMYIINKQYIEEPINFKGIGRTLIKYKGEVHFGGDLVIYTVPASIPHKIYKATSQGWAGVNIVTLGTSNFQLDDTGQDLYFTANQGCYGMLQKYDGASISCPFAPIDSSFSGMRSFAWYNNELYVGGNFSKDIGVTTLFDDIAHWNGTDWEHVWGYIQQNGMGGVADMEVYKGKLYFAGALTSVTPPYTNVPLIAYNGGTNWEDVGNIHFEGTIAKLFPYNGYLYVLGNFISLTNPELSYLARWDGSNWSSIGTFNGTVTDITAYNGSLYMIGTFTQINGIPYYRIAKYTEATAIDAAFDTKLSVYPNPAKEILSWEIPISLSASYQIQISDMTGKQQKTATYLLDTEPKIGVSDLAQGVYLLEIITPQGIYRQKWVKE